VCAFARAGPERARPTIFGEGIEMARPDCPRCGSDLVVAAPSGEPSEQVLELRGGKVPAIAPGGGFAHWLCRSCGHQWDPEAYPDRWVPGPGDPLPDPSGLLADLEVPSEPSEEPPTIDDERASPGALLRRAREEAGTSLSQASKATSIWERHLQALEVDAPLEEFPAPSYARFFLREYAEFLRLDPEPLLRDFDARHPVVEEPPLEPLPDGRGRRRALAGALALLSIAALIVIALRQPAAEPGPRPTMPAGVGPVRVHDSGHVPLATLPARQPDGLRAVLRLTQPCWVEAVAGGEVLAASTFQPGEKLVYRADELLELRLGNAGGVRLRVNGERVETGDLGQVVSLTFSWDAGRVLTERR
jgi:hypothetical protein